MRNADHSALNPVASYNFLHPLQGAAKAFGADRVVAVRRQILTQCPRSEQMAVALPGVPFGVIV
jgi:hypothetical protein